MEKRIIYINDNGGVSVIIPATCGLTVEQIAEKDVPPVLTRAGEKQPRPFRIVSANEIPADRDARDAWSLDGDMKIKGASK